MDHHWRYKGTIRNSGKTLIVGFLKERGLELSPEQTNITHINDGFNFLSQNIRKYENKLIIKPSKKNIKNFLEDIRVTIRTNKSMAQEELIKMLNPKLTGWANYHNAVYPSASTFKRYHITFGKHYGNGVKGDIQRKTYDGLKVNTFISSKDKIGRLRVKQLIKKEK